MCKLTEILNSVNFCLEKPLNPKNIGKRDMKVNFKRNIAETISLLTKIEKEKIESLIEIPPNPELGDYAIPCFQFARKLRANPVEIAKNIEDSFYSSSLENERAKVIQKVEAKGPYINIFLNREISINDILKNLIVHNFSGMEKYGKGKTVVIDYSSPNIAKPFGIGHLRSTVIGNSLKKIFNFLGYNVIGINHLGDWGTQFGKLITAYKKWGDEKELDNEPVKYLYSLYVKFHKEAEQDPELEEEARRWFAKLEKGDPEAISLWEKFCKLSLGEFKRIYKRLNVEFEYYMGESFYSPMLDQTIEEIVKSGITKISEGALIVPLGDDIPPALLRKKDGSTLYITRDLAAAIYRYNRFKFDLMLYVVGSPQALHFKQLFKVLDKMSKKWVKNCHHVPFGHISFENESMSTRKGNIILLEDVINRAVDLARKTIEEKNPEIAEKDKVAEAVGIGAIIFNDLKNSRIKDIVFDWNEILNFNGETGVYLQYTHARITSLMKKFEAKYEKIKFEEGLKYGQELFPFVMKLNDFEDVVLKSSENFEPSIISRYLLDLASEFNSYYNRYRFITEDYKQSLSKIVAASAVKSVIKKGLNLLGIEAIEEM